MLLLLHVRCPPSRHADLRWPPPARAWLVTPGQSCIYTAAVRPNLFLTVYTNTLYLLILLHIYFFPDGVVFSWWRCLLLTRSWQSSWSPRGNSSHFLNQWARIWRLPQSDCNIRNKVTNLLELSNLLFMESKMFNQYVYFTQKHI